MPQPVPLWSLRVGSALELDDLRLLVVLAEELHFGRAAARLHLSQPGLSYRLKKMEDNLGYALLARTQRRVELTAAGAAVLQAAPRILDDTARLVEQGRRVAGGDVGSVRIGFVGTVLYSSLPVAVRHIRARYPDIGLELSEMKTAVQVRALQQGELDLGMVHLPLGATAGMETTSLSIDTVGLALPSDHRLAGDESVELGALAEDDFVLFPRDLEPHTHDSYVQACLAAGFAPRVAYRAVGLQTILGLVAAGMGAAFVAESVASNLRRTGVVFRPIRTGAPSLTTGVAWMSSCDNPAMPMVRDLMVQMSTAT